MAETKKCVPGKISREAYRALEDIVGPEWISEERSVVECYSKFSVDAGGTLKKHMKDPSNIPACIVFPESTEEVQAIMRICNRYKINVIPFTNGMITFNGPTTPDPTVCVHVSRMNKVLEINEDNMTARLQAYADYAQLQADAMKKGLWNGGTPLATTLCKLSSQSAFAGVWQTDHKFGTLSRNIISIKVVLPTGDVLVTGSDAVSGMDTFWEYGPGPDLFSLVRGSGGTTGVVTEVVVQTAHLGAATGNFPNRRQDGRASRPSPMPSMTPAQPPNGISFCGLNLTTLIRKLQPCAKSARQVSASASMQPASIMPTTAHRRRI